MGVQQVFSEALRKYTDEQNITEQWKKIHQHYSQKSRCYHNLHHLESLLIELMPFKDEFLDWNAAVFAIVYHDVVYEATNSDNEEQSAIYAAKELSKCKVPHKTVDFCGRIILATKSHELSDDIGINLFLDADMSILGKPWDAYMEYCKGVRKEYSIYPDFLYNPGRVKVLKHFLAMANIFKTQAFAERYEEIARQNIAKEIEMLSR